MLKKILKYILATSLVCYMVFALVIVPLQKDNDCCRGVDINISNNKLGTINNETIVEMLVDEGLYPENEVMDSIRCSDIENFIGAMSLVKECQVYKSNGKRIKVDIVCREPVLKVLDKSGATYYVDIEGKKIDDIKKPLLLPVASGDIDDSMIGYELQCFAMAMAKDPFWFVQIEQIYFNEKKEAVITPRMGDHVIEIGTIRQLDEKLENVKTFYRKGLNTVGWNKYSRLNIKISDKVICTKRDN